MIPTQVRLIMMFALMSLISIDTFAQASPSQVVDRELASRNFASNKIGIGPVRRFVVYLPAGYGESSQRYPVIYFLPNPFDGDYRSRFTKTEAQSLFDKAITSGAIGPFILVSVDMTTPLGSSWYVNSPVTGNWEDSMVQEVVPYIDAHFRTLPSRDSRAITGIFMGGYGAIRFAMRHPDVFGSVYAMHPVGTGSGLQIMDSRPDWAIIAGARSIDDVKRDGFSTIFTSIFQAFLPDVDKPPLFIDSPARREGSELMIDPEMTERLRNNFFLESMVPRYAENLKSLRGFRFDWARSDPNQDHVYSNQAFTHKLNEFGIVHEAEEYNGAWGEPNWGIDGRMYTEVLPFLGHHLIFEESGSPGLR